MCKRLRKIAQVRPGRTKHLRVKSQVICIPQHSFKQEPRPTYVAGTRKALDIPERTHTKSAFLSGEPVWCSVTIDQRVIQQISLESAHGREPTLIHRTNDPHERHYQTRRVKFIGFPVLNKGSPSGVPKMLHNVAIDGIADVVPSGDRCRKRAFPGEAY